MTFSELLHDPGFYSWVLIVTIITILNIWAEGKHKEYIKQKRQAKEAVA